MKQLFRFVLVLFMGPVTLFAQDIREDERLFTPPTLVVTDENGDPSVSVVRSEYYRWHTVPMLPAIFFDHPGEWSFPDRYVTFGSKSESRDYADSSAIYVAPRQSKRPKYSEVLNILGYRMSHSPLVTLGLRGNYSSEPGESAEVAKNRALAVREYLERVWGVDSARLPILPVHSPVNNASASPFQEEARRVDFVSDDPTILGPVTYPSVHLLPLPLNACLVVSPNSDPEDVVSIEIRLLDQAKTLIDGVTIPGHPDSTHYRLGAVWKGEALEKESPLTGALYLEARIVRADGLHRFSNAVSIPIISEREDEHWDPDLSPYDIRLNLQIPFFPPGDTVLTTLQRRIIDRHLQKIDSLSPGIQQEGVLMVAVGRIDVFEDSDIDPSYLDQWGVAREDRLLKDGDRGQRKSDLIGLTVVSLAQGESLLSTIHELNGSFMMDELPVYSRYSDDDDVETRFSGTSSDDDENQSTTPTAIAVTEGRAWAVASYIIDSTNLLLLNSRLPVELMELDGVDVSGFRDRGIASLHYRETELIDFPEQRWYVRGVTLYMMPLEVFTMFDEYVRKDLEKQNRRKKRED